MFQIRYTCRGTKFIPHNLIRKIASLFAQKMSNEIVRHKRNNKLDYDQYWDYLWDGALRKVDEIIKKIKICRNEFSNKVFEF